MQKPLSKNLKLFFILTISVIILWGSFIFLSEFNPDDTGTFPPGMTAEETVRYLFEQTNKRNYENAESLFIPELDFYEDNNKLTIISCQDYNLSDTHTKVEVHFIVESSFCGIGGGLEDGEHISVYSLYKVDNNWKIKDWGPLGL